MGIHSLNHRLWTSVVEGFPRPWIGGENGKPQGETEAGCGSVMTR